MDVDPFFGGLQLELLLLLVWLRVSVGHVGMIHVVSLGATVLSIKLIVPLNVDEDPLTAGLISNG